MTKQIGNLLFLCICVVIEHNQPMSSQQASGPNRTLTDYVNEREHTWSKESFEYKKHLAAIQDMFNDTGYPVSMLDKPSVRRIFKICDSKFTLPSMFSEFKYAFYLFLVTAAHLSAYVAVLLQLQHLYW